VQAGSINGILAVINALPLFNMWASVSFHETTEKEFPRLCMGRRFVSRDPTEKHACITSSAVTVT
jgi:hypothetical protein